MRLGLKRVIVRRGRGRGAKGLAGQEACFGEEVEHAGDKEMCTGRLRARA